MGSTISTFGTERYDPEYANTSFALNARAAALVRGGTPMLSPTYDGLRANFKGFTFGNESTVDENMIERLDIHK